MGLVGGEDTFSDRFAKEDILEKSLIQRTRGLFGIDKKRASISAAAEEMALSFSGSAATIGVEFEAAICSFGVPVNAVGLTNNTVRIENVRAHWHKSMALAVINFRGVNEVKQVLKKSVFNYAFAVVRTRFSGSTVNEAKEWSLPSADFSGNRIFVRNVTFKFVDFHSVLWESSIQDSPPPPPASLSKILIGLVPARLFEGTGTVITSETLRNARFVDEAVGAFILMNGTEARIMGYECRWAGAQWRTGGDVTDADADDGKSINDGLFISPSCTRRSA